MSGLLKKYTLLYGSPVYIWNTNEYYGNFFSYPVIQALTLLNCPYDPDTGEETFIFEGGGIERIMDFFLYNLSKKNGTSLNWIEWKIIILY